MKQIRNRVSQVSSDTLVNVIIPSSPFLGQEAMVPVSAIGGGGESGEWNPTPTNVSGSPTVSVLAGNYSRVGGVGTCSLFLEVTQGTAESDCEFRLDLPIASNFANVKDAFGIIAYNGITPTELLSWNIKANISTNDISIELTSVTDDFAYQYIYAILQYVVI